MAPSSVLGTAKLAELRWRILFRPRQLGFSVQQNQVNFLAAIFPLP